VHVRSDRRFHFDVAPETFWSAVETVDAYSRWWPWLRVFEANGLVPGDRWNCVVRPPLPYGLGFTLTLDEVVPPRLIRASVAGDLTGNARLDVQDSRRGSVVRLRSTLAPAGTLARAVAAVAPPIVRFGHDWVLETGVRQFRQRAL
jgi:uncharacterized protein YndB with AHSA1/START domain